jgi:fused signal recognition particle receptor
LSDDRPPDENRDKPKPGLFKRLFGRQELQTPHEEPIPAAETPVVDAVSSPPSPETPVAEILEPSTANEDETSKASLFKRLFGGAEPRSAPVDALLAEAATPEPPPAAKRTWWTRLREGLSRSSGSIGTSLVEIFTKRKLDDAMLEDLEDILIRSDLGVATATKIAKAVGKNRYDKMIDVDEVKAILAAEVEQVLAPLALPLTIDPAIKPFVILIVGVNGSGKTTTIGKLALKLTQEGKKVTLAAGDTFRAAAIEQLRIWGERLGCPVIAKEQGGDAAGLAFDAIKAAQAGQADVLLMDTAGRLQNRAELMAELEKIIRVMKKIDASAPHAVILVLDATVGQNAMTQVEIFGRVAGVTGLVMTKLDGTARGGILVAVSEKFHLPVHFIGVGETAEDLESFEARDFARAIAGIED